LLVYGGSPSVYGAYTFRFGAATCCGRRVWLMRVTGNCATGRQSRLALRRERCADLVLRRALQR